MDGPTGAAANDETDGLDAGRPRVNLLFIYRLGCALPKALQGCERGCRPRGMGCRILGALLSGVALDIDLVVGTRRNRWPAIGSSTTLHLVELD